VSPRDSHSQASAQLVQGSLGVAIACSSMLGPLEGACGEPSEKQKRCCSVKQHAIVGEAPRRNPRAAGEGACIRLRSGEGA
jgi:hypothetical protein